MSLNRALQPCSPSLIAVLAALVVAEPAAVAQSGVGSENFALLGPEVGAAGGRQDGASYSAELLIGLGTPFATVGPAHIVEVHPLADPIDLAPDGPPFFFGGPSILLDAKGGEKVDLFGLRLDADPLSFSIAGQPVTSVAVNSTTATLFTPPGTDSLGNSLGVVAGTLFDTDGAAHSQSALAFRPSLVIERPSAPAESPTFRVDVGSGSWVAVAAGFVQPGLDLPFAGLEGALLPLLGLTIFEGFTYAPDGVVRTEIPAVYAAALSGITLQVQAIELVSFVPFSGRFTEAIDASIAP